jgi:hypothetical protein
MALKLGDQYKALLPVILLNIKPTVVQGRPEIERDYDAMTAMIANTYTPFYNEMLEGAAGVYAANFTTDEMRQMEAFYRLPVGQKLLERSQGIAQQTMQIGRDVGRKATCSSPFSSCLTGRASEKRSPKAPKARVGERLDRFVPSTATWARQGSETCPKCRQSRFAME